MISKNQLGIIFMILSVISFSVMDIVVKLMSSHYPTGQLIFFRGFFGLIPILFIIPKERFGNLLKTEKIKLHLVRAFGGAFAMTFLYLGLKFLPIADAITISFAAPIFATIFSIIFLNEKVRLIRWLAIFFGLTGVIIVLKPGTELFTYYSFFPILFCIGFATISIAIKKLSKTEPDYLIALYFTLVLILFGLVSISMGWKKIDISDIHYLVIIGLSGSIGNIFLTKSIREDLLYQSAFDPVDQFTSLPKQYLLMKVILTLYKEALKAIEAGVEIEQINNLKVLPLIARARLIPEDKAKVDLEKLVEQIKLEIQALKGEA